MPLNSMRDVGTLPRYASSLDRQFSYRGRKAARRPLFGSKRKSNLSRWQKGGLLFLTLILLLSLLAFIGTLVIQTTTHTPETILPRTQANSRRSLLSNPVYSANFTLTLFTAPREFDGVTGEKQRAAIVSWLALRPQPRVVLIGSDPELGDVAQEYAPLVTWDNETDTNFLGLPLFHSMLLRARAATTDVTAIVEPDTILLPDFSAALAKARAVFERDWLLFARRHDVRNFPFRVEEVFRDEIETETGTGTGTGIGTGVRIDTGSETGTNAETVAGTGTKTGAGTGGRTGIGVGIGTGDKVGTGTETETGTSAELAERAYRWVDSSVYDEEVEHLWALELLDGDAREEERYKQGPGGMHAFVRDRGTLHRCRQVAVWAWDAGETPLHSGIMPPFIDTRGSYDEWLLHEAVSAGQRQVIDASHAISAVRVLGHVANLQPSFGHSRGHSKDGEYRDTRTLVQKAGGHLGVHKQAGSEHTLWKAGPMGAGWEVALNRHLAQSYGTFGSGNVEREAPWRLGDCGLSTGELCFFQREEGIHTWAVPFEIEQCEDEAVKLEGVLAGSSPRARAPVGSPMKLAELLPLVANPGGTITLVVVANNYREMLMSFVCRLNALGVRNVLVGAVDSEVYRYASEQGLPVFQDLFGGDVSPDDCHFGTQCFRDVTKLKSRTVVKVLQMGYNVLMSDVDVIWFQDPTPIMLAFGPNTFVGQSDQHNDTGPANDERRLNSGFYLARAEPTTVEALAAIAEHAATTQLSEQPSFQHVLCQAEGSRKVGNDECEFKNGLRVVFLNRTQFPNGATSFIWEKEHTKEYCEERGCVVLHNNWVKGRPYKFWREKYKGFWRYNAHYRTCQYDWMDSTNLGLY